MDVTKENFAEVLPGLETALQDCEFVAIDFEMTGISLPGNGGSSRSNYGDTPKERYAKMYPISSRYNIVQMGVCIFSKSDDKTSLVARPYNFYTFAAEGEDITLSLSAMHFLKGQGMDFNKWVRQGVSYTNEAGEAYLLKKLEQEREQDRQDAKATAAAAAGGGGGGAEKSRMKLTKAADIEFVKAQMETVTAWVESEEVEGNGGGSEEEVREAARRFRELSLTRTNAFLRRALFEAIDVAYPEMVTETRNNQVCAFFILFSLSLSLSLLLIVPASLSLSPSLHTRTGGGLEVVGGGEEGEGCRTREGETGQVYQYGGHAAGVQGDWRVWETVGGAQWDA